MSSYFCSFRGVSPSSGRSVCVTCVSKFVSVSVLVVYTGRIGFSVSLSVMSVCPSGFLLVSQCWSSDVLGLVKSFVIEIVKDFSSRLCFWGQVVFIFVHIVGSS